MKLKISRLFHWLYATLMFLPILMFIPSCFYYSLNKYATNETTTQINYKYQSNEVNTIDDVVVDNIYFVDEVLLSSDTQDFYFKIIDLKQISFDTNTWSFIDLGTNNYDSTNIYLNNNIIQISVNNNGLNSVLEYDLNDSDMTLTNLIFSCDSINALTQFKDLYLRFGSLPTYTDYNVIESVETNVQDTISNKMYQAWEGVWTSPLFNWTNTTPLNTGLNGFVSIFGINQSSYIANCLIYLLSITAIYVVFDIVLGIFKWLTHLINK